MLGSEAFPKKGTLLPSALRSQTKKRWGVEGLKAPKVQSSPLARLSSLVASKGAVNAQIHDQIIEGIQERYQGLI